ncbi:MAG TPA: hypothetical protein IGP91_02100 [Thermosynechococcus sp. M46_R2017_013]|nr:hypothetical protein [Thermosynechococcus sp. M46_R2017_013]
MKANLLTPVAILSILSGTGAMLPVVAIPIPTPTQQDLQPPPLARPPSWKVF